MTSLTFALKYKRLLSNKRRNYEVEFVLDAPL